MDSLRSLRSITVIREMDTSGSHPLEVLGDDFNKYYVKSCGNFDFPYYVINEFLCSGLLQVWGIPTPEIAAVRVNAEQIPANLTQRHKAHHFDRVCFGSQSLTNFIEFQQLVDTPNIKAKNFVNPEALFQLGLFDIWVENDDRKPSNYNILLEPDGKQQKIYAIDHAFTFCSMHYRSLQAPYISNTFNDSILHSKVCKSLANSTAIKSFIEHPSINNYFFESVNSSKKLFNEICDNIPAELGLDSDHRKYIYDFLFDDERNQGVLTEFKARI